MYDFNVLVNLRRDRLIGTLGKNKERYVNSFDALKAAWQETNVKYQKDYESWSAKYVAETLGKDDEKPQPPSKIEDRTDEYDIWLDMLNNTVGDYVEVNKDHFDMLWRDNWRWMKIHTDSISAYYACSDTLSAGTIANLGTAALAYNISV